MDNVLLAGVSGSEVVMARDVFDLIHAELDEIPSESWSESEACLVLEALTRIRRARNPAPNVCLATLRLSRTS